ASAASACVAAWSAATALCASREPAEAQHMVAARPWEVVTPSKVRGRGKQVKTRSGACYRSCCESEIPTNRALGLRAHAPCGDRARRRRAQVAQRPGAQPEGTRSLRDRGRGGAEARRPDGWRRALSDHGNPPWRATPQGVVHRFL